VDLEDLGRARQGSPWRALELVAVFVLLPVGVALARLRDLHPLWILAAVAAGALLLLLRSRRFPVRSLWQWGSEDGPQLRRVLCWWLLGSAALAAAVAAWWPDHLFALPRQRTADWALLLAVYPLASVLPQEVLYRAFFLHRYRALLGDGWLLLLANAAAFAILHLAFRNLPAVALTFIAGLLFAHTYRRSGNLPLVLLEHALYGWTVFSVGLDPFFLTAH
jgi:membrane protease YdiL (CAAX protease family)